MGLESLVAASPPRIAAPTPGTLISFFIPGFPAAKQWSGHAGLDVHYVIPWPGTAPPVPCPFPYLYSPHIGLGCAPTVMINFVPSSKTGTKGLLFMGGIPHIGFHLVYGPTLVQGCPSHLQEIVIAAMTVLNTGGLQARLTSVANACNETGPAISFDLPTAMVCPINNAYNVLVGGPDGVDMITLAFNVLGSFIGIGLGKLNLAGRLAGRIGGSLFRQAVVKALVTGAQAAVVAGVTKVANNAVDFFARPNDGSKSFGAALMDGVGSDMAVAFGLGVLGSGLGSITSLGRPGASGFTLGGAGDAGGLGSGGSGSGSGGDGGSAGSTGGSGSGGDAGGSSSGGGTAPGPGSSSGGGPAGPGPGAPGPGGP